MDWKLFEAAASGKTDYLVPTEAQNLISQVTPQKDTVLHIAVNFKQKEFANQVLRLCPSLLLKANTEGDTPLHVAARIGCLESVELLINSAKRLHEDIESQEVNVKKLLRMVDLEKKETALHVAVRNGHLGVVKKLIEADIRLLDWVNNAGQSPLSVAVLRGSADIILHILETSPSISPCRGTSGFNALHVAVVQHLDGFMERLVKMRPELIKEADLNKWTPLHYAALSGDLRAVQLFLQYDSSAGYLLDNDEMSPLHIGANEGHVDVVRQLVQRCPYIGELLDKNGRTAFHFAVIAGDKKMVKHMLKMPKLVGLINKPDKEGNTPLHLAIVYEKYTVVSILAHDKRVDKQARNNEFLTAIDIFESKKPKMNFAVEKVFYQLKGTNGAQYALQSLGVKFKEGISRGEPALREAKPGLVAEKEGYNELNMKMFDTHMVVAVLIATVTFAAAFTMPGGYESEGPDQGLPTFINKFAFKAFIIFDTIAFCLSAATVQLLFSASYGGYDSRPDFFDQALTSISVAMLSMGIAFVTGLHLTLAKSVGLAITADVMIGGFTIKLIAQWFFDPIGYYIPGLGRVRRYLRYRFYDYGIL